jgi:hypothetical protein
MKLLLWVGELYTKYLVWRYGTREEWEKEKSRNLPDNTIEVVMTGRDSTEKES